jgi:hypothetical protein
MNYDSMLQEIAENHSAHWGGTYEEMKSSDKRIEAIALQYPELYAQALADYNEMLRKM